jgi:hypothetical protein
MTIDGLLEKAFKAEIETNGRPLSAVTLFFENGAKVETKSFLLPDDFMYLWRHSRKPTLTFWSEKKRMNAVRKKKVVFLSVEPI